MFLTLFFLITLVSAPIHAHVYTVYAHGIVDTPYQVKRFWPAIITDTSYTKCVAFQDVQKESGYGINRLISEVTTSKNKPINRSKMHMAGPQDIKDLHETIIEIPESDKIVLFGCSRGAAAAINELGQNNPNNIAAVILDASPASMPETIHPILAALGIHHSYDKTIFSILFPQYHKNLSTPLQSIKKIQNKDLPILLIHSQDDFSVPYHHSLQLYKEFINNGFRNMYLVTIAQGKHAFLLQDPRVKHIYVQAVHSFYKQHKLPYDEQYANADLTIYQPDINYIEEKITQAQNTLRIQYEQNKYRNLKFFIFIIALSFCYALYKNHKFL